MSAALLVLALCLQIPAPASEEVRALLADVRAWLRSNELPHTDELDELRALVEELGATEDAPTTPEYHELVRELGNLGHALAQADRRPEGSSLVAWSGERAEAAGDLATRAWSLDWLGQEAWVAGELERAAEFLTHAAEVDERRGARAEAARDRADVARVRAIQGRLEEAHALARRAWELADEARSLPARRSAGEILAGIWLDLGRHRQALELCLELLGPSAEGAPDESQVRLEILAANILADVGRLEAASAHARRAHELALVPQVRRMAPLLHLEPKLSLALLLGDQGHLDDALDLLDGATAEFARLGDLRGLGWAEKNRGFALFAAGRHGEARAAFEEAWRRGAELGVPVLEGLGALGMAESTWFDPSRSSEAAGVRANEALATAERIAGRLHDRGLEWRCAALRGHLWLEQGLPREALVGLEHAVRVIERWRLRLGASGLVEHALRQRSDPYRDAAFAAAALGDPRAALDFAVLLQARLLSELRARRDGPLPTASTPEIDALRERVALLSYESSDQAALELRRVEDELDQALVRHDLETGTRLAPARNRLDVGALTSRMAAQGVDVVLVYLVSRSETLVLRLEAGLAEVRSHRLPVGQAQLEGWIRAVRAPIERLAVDELDLLHLSFDIGAARALQRVLIEPLSLPDDARLGLVLDGVLADLPFELLVTGGETGRIDFARPFAHLLGLEYLGDRHELVVLGSLLSLCSPVEARTGGAVVLLGPESVAPPGAGLEAELVARARGTARIVADASPVDLAAVAQGAALLHVAAHGRFDAEHPAHGHLVLGGEGGAGRLQSWQIAELDLSGAEVVLSACHSSRGAWRAGAGRAGLLNGFLLAGAREVVASHWAVESRVTTRFMELYHRARAQGQSAPSALRQTRLQLRSEVDPRGFTLAHPAFWSWSLHR
jgi:tetratricopeptide (TPR) repeat protein